MNWRWFILALGSGLICLAAILLDHSAVMIVSAIGYLVGTILTFRSAGA